MATQQCLPHVPPTQHAISEISNKLAVTVVLWKNYGNHSFSIVQQASTKQSLKMLMDLDWPYQN